jgi:hypothetical protein
MFLTPTREPGYADVVVAARDGGIDLPPHLAHLFLVLVTHYPEIRPTAAKLASHTGTSVRTVERNLAQLVERGRMTSITIKRGIERGGTSWRFLVLPTLTRIGQDPLLVGRGPDGWKPAPLEVGVTYDHFPSLVTVGR